MNDLIDKRNKRTKQRKEKKRKMDSLISLSKDNDGNDIMSLSATVATISDTNQTARLLDEGYCDNGFVIKKGTLEKYLNGENEYVTGWEMIDGSWQRTEVLNLTDDFTGTVNLGHQDFATHPFILGEFNKSDLTLVDIENDRKALDINVRLDEDSTFVKELRRQPYDIGVSAEFYYHVDWDATEALYNDYGMYMPVIDEIFIFAYGLVGECGNVNSSGLELKETNMPNENKDILEEQMEKPEEQTIKESAEEETEIPPTDSEEPVEADETAKETAEESDGEEAETEEADEEDSDEGESDEADELAEALSIVESLRAENESLKAENKELNTKVTELTEANESLKKTNRKLNSKLQNEYDKKKAFVKNVKGLSVQLLPDEEAETSKKEKKANKEKVTKDSYFHGDGIGEI